MARPREFDPEVALQGATNIFWRRGFKATSLPDLLDAMGLTRGSFYKAFRDKENVYMLALDYYDRTVLSSTVADIDRCAGQEAWICLAPLFAPLKPDRSGCFICNAMVELGPDYPLVADKANAMANRLRKAIENVVERDDPTRTREDVAKVADLVLNLYFGRQAIGKAGGTELEWTDRLKHVLRL
ncbi:MAG: TetR/AcrR family transcriptional regulator [Pseudomonadota bacterium]